MGRLSFACLFLLLGCSTSDKPPLLGDTDAHVVVVPPEGGMNGPCDPPVEGCPCPANAEPLYCGTIYRYSGNKVDCAKGYRTCQTDGGWGPCLGPSIYMGD